MGSVEIIAFILLLVSMYLFFYKLIVWIYERYTFRVFSFLQIFLNFLFVAMIIAGFKIFPALAHSVEAFTDPKQVYGAILVLGGGAFLFILYCYFIYRTSFLVGLLVAIMMLPLSIILCVKILMNMTGYRRTSKKEKRIDEEQTTSENL